MSLTTSQITRALTPLLSPSATSMPKASVRSASPASMAVDSPKTLWFVGIAPPERVVVHRRQVVVYERIRMYHLYRARGGHDLFGVGPHGLSRGDGEYGAEPLSPGKQRCNAWTRGASPDFRPRPQGACPAPCPRAPSLLLDNFDIECHAGISSRARNPRKRSRRSSPRVSRLSS